MKISTKGRYGLRLMADLAIHHGDGPVPLNVLARRQGISLLYLEQVVSILKKAGLTKSVKGPRGGYMLGASPSDLTLGRILRVLEGGLAVVEENPTPVGDPALARCIREMVWDPMNEAVNRLADGTTLSDLARDHQRRQEPPEGIYYI